MTTVELAMLSVLCVIASVGVVSIGGTRERGAVPATERATPLRPASGAVEERSVAVLPFVNMSSDPEQEYFSDGITEELLNVLAQVPGLRVSARTSSFSFKGKNVPVDEIGKRLGVAHVLEGSVRKAGGRIRVTAQLVRADNGYHLWSQTYDRDLKDVFAVQDEVAGAIAAALRVRMSGGAVQAHHEAPTSSLEAHDLYLRGRAAFEQMTEQSLYRALAFFRSAVERDPHFARAYAGIALAYEALADAYLPPLEAYPKALVAARRAVELDSTLAEGHVALGHAVLVVDWDLTGAEQHYQRAIELKANATDVRFLSGLLFCATNRAREGLEQVRQGLALDPLSILLAWGVEFCLAALGDWDRIASEHPRIMAVAPDFVYLEPWLAAAHREKGEYAAALTEYERLRPQLGGQPLYGHAITLARMGRTAEARRVLAELETLAGRRYVAPGMIAAVHESLGDRESALEWLAKGVRMHDWLSVLGPRAGSLLPDLAGIVSDPRYQALVRSAGVVR